MNYAPVRGLALSVALPVLLLLGSMVFGRQANSQESPYQFVPATPTEPPSGEPHIATSNSVWVTPTMLAMPRQETEASAEPTDVPTVQQGGYSGGPKGNNEANATQSGLVKPAVPTPTPQAMRPAQTNIDSPNKIAVMPHRYAQQQNMQPDQAPLYATPNTLQDVPTDEQREVPQFVPALVEGAPVRPHVVLPQQPTPIVLLQQPTPTHMVVVVPPVVEPTPIVPAPHTPATPETTPSQPVIGYESQLLDSQESTLVDIGMPAPDFAFTLTDGSTHSLSEVRGKNVLVTFMTTWCSHCNDEMPHLQRAGIEFLDDGLVILGIVADEQVEMIEMFAQHHQATFPLIADPSGAIRNRYGVEGFPKSYFINPEGMVVAIHLGSIDRDTIAQIIEQM